jgi:hypothetical protein
MDGIARGDGRQDRRQDTRRDGRQRAKPARTSIGIDARPATAPLNAARKRFVVGLGGATTVEIGVRSGAALAVASSSASIVVGRRNRGSVDRAASAAA